MKTLATTVFLAAFLVVAAATQDAPKTPPPALTLEQKQAIQLAAKDIEIAQLRAQAAAAEFNAARESLTKLLALYVPAGYQLNEKFELVKVPPSALALPVVGPPASAPAPKKGGGGQ